MNTELMFSSKFGGWRTPRSFFEGEQLNQRFHFTTDVGADHNNALCKDYIGLDNGRDALKVVWGEIDYCNPPYGRKVPAWVSTGYQQSLMDKIVVMLLPGRVDTRWFYNWIWNKASEVWFVKGRIKFDIGPHNHKARQLKDGTKIVARYNCTELHPAPFPSMVIVYDHRTRHHGTKFFMMDTEGNQIE